MCIRDRLCAALVAAAAQGVATGASAALAAPSTRELECAAAYGADVWAGCVHKLFGCASARALSLASLERNSSSPAAPPRAAAAPPAARPCACASLDLSSRSLAAVPRGALALGAELRSLSLASNELRELPVELLAALTRLVALDVSSNQLAALPVELGALTQLRELDVSGNRDLESLPSEALAKLAKLAVLRAARAGLTSLPPSLARLPKLQLVDASDNQLRALPDGLVGGAPALRALLLGGNALTALSTDDAADEPSDGMDGAGALEFLHVRGNALTELPRALLRRLAPRLGVLDVRDNALVELDGDELDEMRKLRVVAAGGNALSAAARDALARIGARGVSVDAATREVCDARLELDWSEPCAPPGDADGAAIGGANASAPSRGANATGGDCPPPPLLSTYCAR